jgi:hypothetical protein
VVLSENSNSLQPKRLLVYPGGEGSYRRRREVPCEPLMGNTVHVLSAAHNLELMKKAQATVQLGARLLLVDHWTDPTHSQSLLRRVPPVMWLEFSVARSPVT